MSEETSIQMINLAATRSGSSFGSVDEKSGLPKARRIPRRPYKVRCKTQTYKLSSKQKPMFVLELEIVEPETLRIEGVEAAVAGIEANAYLSLSDGATYALTNLHSQLGLPIENVGFHPEIEKLVAVDDEGNAEAINYEGMEFYIEMYSELRERMSEDEEGNETQMINPLTGEKVTSLSIRCGDIFTAA